jgi:molybdopterin-containing oxidoreductase family iron-sulfur binding subunit
MSSLKTPTTGKAYWRSLDELADNDEFRRFVRDEFPSIPDDKLAPASRRSFLKFMGASVALAGMTGCRWPTEQILPFAERPAGYTPGIPVQFATAMELAGVATGLVVTSYDGRPIKIEGNPLHPGSLGSTSAIDQAAILEMYDPERSSDVVQRADDESKTRDWAAFESFAGPHFAALEAGGGAGLRVLSEASASPSVAALRARLLQRFPRARWVEYEPVSRDGERRGSLLAFGAAYRTRLALDRAETIVSLDDDFLHRHPNAVRHARDFAKGRRGEHGKLSRLSVVESGYSLTGGMADRRIPVPSRMVPAVAIALAAELFLERGLPLPAGASGLRQLLESSQGHPYREAIDGSIAQDLLDHRGRSLVLAGPGQPPEVHALVHAINIALGNVGSTIEYVDDPDPERPTHLAAIRELAGDIDAGAVTTLVVIGGNPAFDGPADLDLASRIAAVDTTIRLGLYEDETSELCDWHLPRAHFLETWGDARAWDGTISVVQPLIAPLWGGRSPIELLALLAGEATTRGHDIVQTTLAARTPDEAAWRRALHDGLVADTAWPTRTPSLRQADWAGDLSPFLSLREELPENEVELSLVPAAGIHDGRFANSGWLQELPDPLTKLTWDNALLIGPATAGAFGLEQEDRVRVTAGDRSVELPVYVMPGQTKGTAAVWTGYGRRKAGTVGAGVGVDVYPLRTTDEPDWSIVTLEKLRGSHRFATTQNHWAIDTLGAQETERRASVHAREIDIATFVEHPEAVKHMGVPYHPVDLWNQHQYDGHAWGMSIDLSVCTGCNACITACQAENNIPFVGKDEVTRGREMHWIRVDRYFQGEPEAPSVSVQPITCHHCENAPCEQVCPVAATVHDGEGLNVMVYNRCVGTRYCLNNCPYKVRRFNWFNNHKDAQPVEQMKHNPEVTVRARGVMEKCTFCIQRINNAKIRAKNDGRTLRDGEITTACEQACPTRAITFGDLGDPESRVRRSQEDDRSYALLDEMNVRPRLRYLARLRNRGDAAEPYEGGGGHGGGEPHGEA